MAYKSTNTSTARQVPYPQGTFVERMQDCYGRGWDPNRLISTIEPESNAPVCPVCGTEPEHCLCGENPEGTIQDLLRVKAYRHIELATEEL